MNPDFAPTYHPKSARSIARRLAATFVFGSVGWILITDSLMHLVNASPDTITTLHTIKGIAYVVVIAVILYRIALSHIREVEKAHQQTFDAKMELVSRLGLAAEYRDDCTGGHNNRIGRIAQVVSRQMGLSDEFCEMIRHAATLHDIGKIAIPDAILLKPGPLTPEERKEMERHVELGADLLEGSTHPLLCLALTIVWTHHENWDGTGYPKKISNTDIPLAGRIVAVCDVFDALTSDRPYKKAWTVEDAVAEICKLSGSKFDPAVTQAFLSCVEEIRTISREARSCSVQIIHKAA